MSRLSMIKCSRTTAHADYQRMIKHKGIKVLCFMVQYKPKGRVTNTLLYQLNNTEHGFMLFSSLIAAKQYINANVN